MNIDLVNSIGLLPSCFNPNLPLVKLLIALGFNIAAISHMHSV